MLLGMSKASSLKKFNQNYQKVSWFLFGFILFLQVIIDYVFSSREYITHTIIWHIGLTLILGGVIYWFWERYNCPRHSYLGISFALASISELITNTLSFFSLNIFNFTPLTDFLGGVGDILLLIVGYALETFLILSLLLKWATKGTTRKVLLLSLGVISVAILIMVVFFFILIPFFPIRFN